jgi:hypothetical protein
MALKPAPVRRKQFAIDAGVLAALEAFSRDSGASLDGLLDEALRDLLKKHRRPLSLKDALRDSARALPANDPELKAHRKRSTRER